MDVDTLLSGKGDRVATARPDSTVAEAVTQLREEGVGALVVSADGDTIAGIISERDVVRGLAEHGQALLSMKVSDLMTASVKTCERDANIQDIMSLMTQSRFRHLPVVEGGKLCGIISIGDVVKNRLEELEAETNTLRDFIVGRS